MGQVGHNFGWVGQNAFGPSNNWPVCLLILRKISEIDATRCQILRLKCTRLAFCWVSTPTPLAVFKGLTSKGKGEEGQVRGRGEEVE